MRQDPSLNLEMMESARLSGSLTPGTRLSLPAPPTSTPQCRGYSYMPIAVPSSHAVGSGDLNSGFYACISGSHPIHSDTSTLKLGNLFQAKLPVP